MQEHAAQIRLCYERELKNAPALAGKVKLKWTLNVDGAVARAEIESDELHNAAVADCLLTQVKTWVFPKPKGGGLVIVSYPFVFKRAG